MASQIIIEATTNGQRKVSNTDEIIFMSKTASLTLKIFLDYAWISVLLKITWNLY